MPEHEITLSIVSHGQNALVNLLLADIQHHCADRVTLVLTENIADTTALAAGALTCPVERIANDRVRGFGANHNAAFKHCRTPWFCVVNPDIRLPADPFPALIAALGKGGVAGPLVRSPAGDAEDSARRFPTAASLLKKALSEKRQPDYPVDRGTQEVDWVAGMFMLFSASDFRSVGGFDEAYFLYYEDVDLCRRLRAAGSQVIYAPSAEVVHDARRASRRNPRLALHHLKGALRLPGKRMKDRLLRLVRSPSIKRAIERVVIPVGDVLLAPAVLSAALLLKLVRRVGVYRMTIAHAIFRRVGVFPIRDHYYEPMFHPRHLHRPLDTDRALPGIDMNVAEQLALLERFRYGTELEQLARHSRFGFNFDNPNFGAGDAEFLYSAIRHFKPRRVLEIGSGFSTLVSLEAIASNQAGQPEASCELTCVEPYEMPWLEKTPGIRILRQRVEDLDDRHVTALRANDILFIDSSHVIRPQGDVVREYLELLPLLAPGVLVHIHDISTPRDYPRRWVVDEVRLWNEQYLFEAFMCGNSGFRIVGALNYLFWHHRDALHAAFPVLRASPHIEPGSMWLLKS